jgi:TonB family protein
MARVAVWRDPTRIFGLLAILLAGCETGKRPPIHAGFDIPPDRIHFPPSAIYDNPPVFISGPSPIYPISRLLARENGFATVKFTIAEAGDTADIKVTGASNFWFGRHLANAVELWKFKPAHKGDQTVKVRALYRMNFTVK